jgi:hypothetical protein
MTPGAGRQEHQAAEHAAATPPREELAADDLRAQNLGISPARVGK